MVSLFLYIGKQSGNHSPGEVIGARSSRAHGVDYSYRFPGESDVEFTGAA